MLDNGYNLAKVELLNWGNFHGYQKFTLSERAEGGPLFAPAPASAILGINGSGKSTLIDALMIVLLPFEGSVKLGVTNDVEGGTGGGRTIKDYVLGKHSSNTGLAIDPGSIYGRKDGCTLVVLHFIHNRHPERSLSMGRGWWYQNHKVSDTQLAFLSYEPLELLELCPNGKTPGTSKSFRQHLKASRPNAQIFDTMQSFFGCVSQSLGGLSRDDLKILNRAFFVKSISNIDTFIRENMLIEQDSPSLDRLMENVRNGHEIAFSIETCEAKIAAIGRILRELKKLVELSEESRQLERKTRLFSLHREWSHLRELIGQQNELLREIRELDVRLPRLRVDVQDAEERARAAKARLLNDDLEGRLAALGHEEKTIRERISWKRRTFENWEQRADRADLKLPSGSKAWERFVLTIHESIDKACSNLSSASTEIEVVRERKYAFDRAVAELREELQHVSQNKTLIPRELHGLREEAVRVLKIPRSHLMFVGELVQVKQESLGSRRAIESVLFPIARNLLCHPSSLQAFTRWLDGEGLKADVTAKRISEEELEPIGPDREAADGRPTDRANRVRSDREVSSSILSMIQVRSESDHPFTHYLWRWLSSTFDYEVVDLKKFRSSDGRLVTAEGLVKKDQRTMRKLKKAFPYSLGWENTDAVEKLTLDLVKLNEERNLVIASLSSLDQTLASAEERKRLLDEIAESFTNVSGLETDVARAQQIEADRQRLLDENPDHQKLRFEAVELEKQAHGLARGLMTLESEHLSKGQLRGKLERLIPEKTRELEESRVYQNSREELSGKEGLEAALDEMDQEFTRRALSRLQFESELKEDSIRIEIAKNKATSLAAVNLGNYRHHFNDPNLPYDISGELPVAHLFAEWTKADERLRSTDLPGAQEKWRRFFDQVLLGSVKDTINEIKSRIHDVGETIRSINDVLKLTNFEDLVDEKRYLQIDAQSSPDERIRRFRKSMTEIEATLGPAIRAQVDTQSQSVMAVLGPFVEEFHKDPSYRSFVTDVRNHFQFNVQSLRRSESGRDDVVEVFSGAKKDAKSSAQTTQLAYALLASCLAYRFRFHDPVGGSETPRLIVLDEFGGKFDNEKPREILKLLQKMGFQSVLVSPMSKADLLADGISHLVLVHKVSASRSKVQSYKLNSREDYQRLLGNAAQHEGEIMINSVDHHPDPPDISQSGAR